VVTKRGTQDRGEKQGVKVFGPSTGSSITFGSPTTGQQVAPVPELCLEPEPEEIEFLDFVKGSGASSEIDELSPDNNDDDDNEYDDMGEEEQQPKQPSRLPRRRW
jgi:hypothetical protein